MVGSQSIKHVIDDILDSFRYSWQSRQFYWGGLHQLHGIRALYAEVLKLVIRGCRRKSIRSQ